VDVVEAAPEAAWLLAVELLPQPPSRDVISRALITVANNFFFNVISSHL
jgi:hypothetical protein